MINENILGGKWKMVKGEIQKVWGKLTDDELEQTRGNINQLSGLVQKRYGENQESVRARINEFLAGVVDSPSRDDLKDNFNADKLN